MNATQSPVVTVGVSDRHPDASNCTVFSGAGDVVLVVWPVLDSVGQCWPVLASVASVVWPVTLCLCFSPAVSRSPVNQEEPVNIYYAARIL